MGDLVEGDDGLPAEEVGEWAKDKHNLLRKYISISASARKRFTTGPARSSAFIDLFCGTGRAVVKDTGEWIDGSPVVAWKASLESGVPFTEVYVADTDIKRRDATMKRLEALDAPAIAVDGNAVDAARIVVQRVHKKGLHLALLDPYGLSDLSFEIVRCLSELQRMDMIAHFSTMDFQRNLRRYMEPSSSVLDTSVPGWRDKINTNTNELSIRAKIITHWKELVVGLGKECSQDPKLITGNKDQRLYWLFLIAEHDLAQKIWKASAAGNQRDLFS